MADFNHCKLVSGLDEIEDLTRQIELMSNGDPSKYVASLEEIYEFALQEKKIVKRAKMLNAMKRVEKYNYVKAEFSDDAGLGVLAKLHGVNLDRRGARQSVHSRQQAQVSEYKNGALRDLQEENLNHILSMGDMDRDVIIAMDKIGKKQDVSNMPKEVIKAAEILRKWNEVIRQDMNKAGAWIGKMEDYIAHQSHDMFKVRNASKVLGLGKTKDQGENYKAWRNYIMNLLDVERTFKGQEDSEKFLRSVYDAIGSGVHFKHMDGVDLEEIGNVPSGMSSIAKRMSQKRMLHFKDGESWYEYNRLFGKGNLRESFFSSLDRAGHTVGLMNELGPNPNATIKALLKSLEPLAKSGGIAGRELFDKRRKQIENAMKVLDGTANIPYNITLAKAAYNLRALKTFSSLGGAIFAALPDTVNMALLSNYHGKGYSSGYKAALDGIMKDIPYQIQSSKYLKGGSDEGNIRRRIAGAAGVWSKSMAGHIADRFSADSGIPGSTARYMRTYFDLNLLSFWTDGHRQAMSLAMQNYVAGDMPFRLSELSEDTQRLYRLFDIDEEIWDMVRKIEPDELDGDKYFTAELAHKISIEDASAYLQKRGKRPTQTAIDGLRNDINIKFKEMFIDQIEYGILEPDVRVRSSSMMIAPPGSFAGEMARFVLQFKSYALSVLLKPVSREIWGRSSVNDGFVSAMTRMMTDGKGGASALTHMVLVTTGLGYISGAAKDILAGKEPRDIYDPETWKNAMIRGGALGLYGDILFNEYNKTGNHFLSSMAGPVPSEIKNMYDLYATMVDGDKDAQEKGAAVFKRLVANTPGANLFYVRPVLNYMLLNEVQENLDPGYFDRIKKASEGNGQKYFSDPSASFWSD